MAEVTETLTGLLPGINVGPAKRVAMADLGCPKVSLLIRRDNGEAAGFYRHLGYVEDDVISLGKRLETDDA